MKRGLLIFFCVVAFLCGGAHGYTTANPLRVLFVYAAEVNDLGWTYQHNLARTNVEFGLGGLISSSYLSSLSEDYSVAYKELKQAADSGKYELIIGCSFGFQFPMVDLAPLYPDIYWLHVSGTVSGPSNFATLFGEIEGARYLSGMAAGLQTKTNIIGFVGAFQIPEVFRGANAFYRGMQSVNPDARMLMYWTSTWYDPDLEAYAADKLMDEHGADVVAHFQDSQLPQQEAARRGVYSLGYHSDMGTFVGQSVLTSAVWHWEPAYAYFIGLVLNGTWQAQQWYGYYASDERVADIGSLSSLLSTENKQLILEQRESFLNGSFQLWCGDRVEDSWKTVNASEDCLSLEETLSMPGLATGIEVQGQLSIPQTQIDISEGMRISMQVLAAVVMLICLGFSVATFAFRKKRVIYFSAPLFLHISLIGSMMMVSAVFPLSSTPPDKGSCTVVVWLISCGFALFFSGLLLKTWRISRIWSASAAMRGVRISNVQLLAMEAVIVGFYIVLNILYTAIDTPEAVVSTSGLPKYQYRIVCNYPVAAEVLMWVLVGVSGFLLAVGILLTFKVRTVIKEFNEAKHLTLCIYDFAFVLVVLVPVVVIISDVQARYLIISLGLIFGTVVAVLALFLPKFWVIARQSDLKTSEHGSRSGVASANPTSPQPASPYDQSVQF